MARGLVMPSAFTSASYRETLDELVSKMALAEPNVQTVKLIAWLFNVPVHQVKEHVRALWANSRKNENEDKRHF